MNSIPDNERISLIFNRRSIRKFESRKVEESKVRLMLEAAMAAPSAVAKDPWRFVVVHSSETLGRIAEGLPNGRLLAAAPLGIMVCGEIGAAHDGREGYMVQDCTAALENMLLAAAGIGLGTCWLGVYPRAERQEHLRTVLDLPEGIIPLAAVAVGYPGETKEPRSRYVDSYVHHETW